MMARVLSALCVSCALGFTLWQAPPGGLLLAQAAVQSPVAQADRDFNRTVSDKDAARFRTFIAEDATFYGTGGAPARGRDAVVEQWAGLLAPDGPTRLQWEPKAAEVARSGDLGFTQGEYTSTTKTPDGKVTERHGYYVTIWRKGPDGRWRVVVDIGSQAAPR